MRRALALALMIVLALLAGGAIARWYFPDWRPGDVATQPAAAVPASAGREAFDRWLAADPSRAGEFAAFEAYIAEQGYADLLPAWTLLRANANKTGRCNADAFVLPPRRMWRNIVSALRLVREQVVPAVGRVTVASAYRDPALNSCSRGARHSRHLGFAALDLIPLDQPDAPTSFRKLCAAWRAAGAESLWGFGAYYDPERTRHNRVARFHVDGTGWRTWGFSYGRASSGCNSL